MGSTGDLNALYADFLPLLRALARGRYAISIGGSRGKRIADERSDVDFRFFYDELVGGAQEQGLRAALKDLIASWGAHGRTVDGYWPRPIAQIDAALDEWLAGTGRPQAMVWTIWGYHLLGDIANQLVLEDPSGVLEGWRRRLVPYPAQLKAAVIARHRESLRYWRTDYHYASKVHRGDRVFLAGITQKLAHDMIQVLFALNDTHYVGDGNNVVYLRDFAKTPARVVERLEAVLYPGGAEPACLERQYRELLALVDEVDALLQREKI
jgi:hypothetical protein